MNTMQEEFDLVVAHLHKQGRPALVGTSCRYRTADGLMCAVGCRIPDDVYSPAMEGSVVSQLTSALGRVLPPEIAEYGDMFDDLQLAHDGWNEGDSFESIVGRLEDIATKHHISYNDPRSYK